MDIALCVNRYGLGGLHATLGSLVAHASRPMEINLHIVYNDLPGEAVESIRRHLGAAGFRGGLAFVKADPISRCGNLRAFHGDWTTYTRLLLPDLLSCDRVLCLDADLLIELDVGEAASIDLAGKPFAAVEGSTVRQQIEHRFYVEELGLDPAGPIFNAGVLLLDLERWRREKLTEKCLEFAHRYPAELMTADQTVLIALFSRNFARLPPSWNRLWYNNREMPSQETARILHFVGAPKPWDLFGRFLHRGFHRWAQHREPQRRMLRDYVDGDNWKRVWRLRRSYARALWRG